MTTFFVELKKARRRHDVLLCLLVTVITALWVGGLSPTSPDELAQGYSELLYSMPVIDALILPVMMAVLPARLWDMETKGAVVLLTALQMAGVAVLGKVHGYTEALPAAQLGYLAVCTLTVELMLFFGEFLIVLRTGSPLPALCVGIVGALLGLFTAFMPPIFTYFVPWGYFIPLSAYEVAHWEQATHTVTYGTRPWNFGMLAFTAALGVVLFVLSWCSVQKEEV